MEMWIPRDWPHHQEMVNHVAEEESGTDHECRFGKGWRATQNCDSHDQHHKTDVTMMDANAKCEASNGGGGVTG